MKSIGAEFLRQDALPGINHRRGMQYNNSSKYDLLSGTQLIQLYKFVCTIPTHKHQLNLHSKPPFSRLLRYPCVKAVMQF